MGDAMSVLAFVSSRELPRAFGNLLPANHSTCGPRQSDAAIATMIENATQNPDFREATEALLATQRCTLQSELLAQTAEHLFGPDLLFTFTCDGITWLLSLLNEHVAVDRMTMFYAKISGAHLEQMAPPPRDSLTHWKNYPGCSYRPGSSSFFATEVEPYHRVYRVKNNSGIMDVLHKSFRMHVVSSASLDALQLGFKSKRTPMLWSSTKVQQGSNHNRSLRWIQEGPGVLADYFPDRCRHCVLTLVNDAEFKHAHWFFNVLFLGQSPGTLAAALRTSLQPGKIAPALAKLSAEDLAELVDPEVLAVLPSEEAILSRLATNLQVLGTWATADKIRAMSYCGKEKVVDHLARDLAVLASWFTADRFNALTCTGRCRAALALMGNLSLLREDFRQMVIAEVLSEHGRDQVARNLTPCFGSCE